MNKLTTMTRAGELKWDFDPMQTLCAKIRHTKDDAVSVTITTRDFYTREPDKRIGVIVRSAGRSPFWLNPEESDYQELLDAAIESKRMPDHVAKWIEDFLKQ